MKLNMTIPKIHTVTSLSRAIKHDKYDLWYGQCRRDLMSAWVIVTKGYKTADKALHMLAQTSQQEREHWMAVSERKSGD